jgi:hypothetical protein
MKPNLQWTDDCSGKKDYDGSILKIFTRYWPRGGGYFVVNNDPHRGLSIEDNEHRPEVKPSAVSELAIQLADDDLIVLTSSNFDGESFEEVQEKVEAWVLDQFQRAVAALRSEFES